MENEFKFSSIFADSNEEQKAFDNIWGAEEDDADLEFVDSIVKEDASEKDVVGEEDDKKFNEPGPGHDQNKPTDDSNDATVIYKDDMNATDIKGGIADAGISKIDPEDITSASDSIATDKNLRVSDKELHEAYKELMREAEANLPDDTVANAGDGVDKCGEPDEEPISSDDSSIVDSVEGKETGTTVDSYEVHDGDSPTVEEGADDLGAADDIDSLLDSVESPADLGDNGGLGQTPELDGNKAFNDPNSGTENLVHDESFDIDSFLESDDSSSSDQGGDPGDTGEKTNTSNTNDASSTKSDSSSSSSSSSDSSATKTEGCKVKKEAAGEDDDKKVDDAEAEIDPDDADIDAAEGDDVAADIDVPEDDSVDNADTDKVDVPDDADVSGDGEDVVDDPDVNGDGEIDTDDVVDDGSDDSDVIDGDDIIDPDDADIDAAEGDDSDEGEAEPEECGTNC